MNPGLLESIPMSGVYVGVVLLMLVSCEVGFQLGVRNRTKQDTDATGSIGPMVGGLLGMLGFLLAFVFAMAASQFELRKQNVLDEANTIGTAYLRTDLIDKQHGTELKRLLQEYVDIRLKGASGHDLNAMIARSIGIHDQLWDQAASAAVSSPNTNTALMIQSINDVIDMHEKRVSGGMYNRVPGSVWIALFAITAFTMATMGLQLGFTGRRRLVAVIPLTLAFAVLVALVEDLDRPQSGLITVGQQAMIDLKNSMATMQNKQ
jgi:hypothetical protein